VPELVPQRAVTLLLDPATRDDTRFYRRLLREAPVVRTRAGWVVAGHQEVMLLARDPRLVIDPRAGNPPLPLTQSERLEALFGRMLNFRDGAPHARLRALVTGAFSATRMNVLAPTVTSLVDEVVDAAIARGRFDAVADLGVPLPVLTSCALLGLPRRDWPRVVRWARMMAGQLFRFGQPPQHIAAVERQLAELTRYVRTLAHLRRGRCGDLIADLQRAVADDELTSFVALLFINGLETVTMAVGTAVAALVWRPGVADAIRRQPGSAPAILDECLRLESPLWMGARRATEPIEVGGATIAPDEPVFLLWAVANRDPRVFADPDSFRPGRPGRHLAFGAGIHHCLGAALANLQGAAVLRRLAERTELSIDLDPAAVPRRRHPALNGYAALPVNVRPRVPLERRAA
jgi:cytochrome P450